LLEKQVLKILRKSKKLSPYLFEVKYAGSAKKKAILVSEIFGDGLTGKNFDLRDMEEADSKLLKQLIKENVINKEVLFEYEKLVKGGN